MADAMNYLKVSYELFRNPKLRIIAEQHGPVAWAIWLYALCEAKQARKLGRVVLVPQLVARDVGTTTDEATTVLDALVEHRCLLVVDDAYANHYEVRSWGKWQALSGPERTKKWREKNRADRERFSVTANAFPSHGDEIERFSVTANAFPSPRDDTRQDKTRQDSTSIVELSGRTPAHAHPRDADDAAADVSIDKVDQFEVAAFRQAIAKRLSTTTASKGQVNYAVDAIALLAERPHPKTRQRYPMDQWLRAIDIVVQRHRDGKLPDGVAQNPTGYLIGVVPTALPEFELDPALAGVNKPASGPESAADALERLRREQDGAA